MLDPACRSRLSLAAALFAFVLPRLLPAQQLELIGVDFAGTAWGIAMDGQKRLIGPTGATGCNAMADQAGVLWASARSGARHQLVTIDPITAAATVHIADLGVDLRGLESNPTFGPGVPELLGIANTATNADVLVAIDVDTAVVTTIGPTGRTGIQSLEFFAGELWGWDATAGLVKISRTTGQASDPFPSVGTLGAGIQYLTTDRFGRLVGGNSALYRIDHQTGVPTLLGADGFVDLRGAVAHRGRLTPFEVGCPAGGGGTTLVGGGELLPGTSLGFASVGHTPFATGVLMIGFQRQTAGLVGTSCLQFVTGDLGLPVTASASGFAKDSFVLPGTFGTTLHLQLLMLENVPGGFVTTNGLTAELPF